MMVTDTGRIHIQGTEHRRIFKSYPSKKSSTKKWEKAQTVKDHAWNIIDLK